MAQRTTNAAIFTHNISAKIDALKGNPSLSVSQRLELAHAWWQKGLIEGNVFHIDNALKLINPRLDKQQPPQIYLLRSKLNMSLHRFNRAKDDLKAAWLTAQNNPNKSNASKTLLNELEQLQQQIGYLTGKTTIDKKAPNTQSPKNPQTTATLSAQVQYLLANHQPQRAQIAINQAVEKFNDSHPIIAVALHLLSAQVAIAQGKPSLQLAHLNKALVRLPTHVGALKAMANLHQANKDYQKAINCLNQARKTSPDPSLLVMLADNHHLAGRHQLSNSLTKQAFNKLKMMTKLFPNSYGNKSHQHLHATGQHHQHSH